MRISLLPLVLVLSSCAFLKSLGQSADGEVVYGADADSNMAKGDEALEAKNFPEAARYYEYIRTKYPYIEAAKTAELRLADTDYARDRFIEARDRYQNFVRLHPTHPKVEYAAFQAALTHYRDIPSDLFILPPSTEKDQVEVRAALTAINDFLNAYSHSEFVPEAKKIQTDVKRRLAEHEMYVAEFYAKRDRWPAVINRLQNVVKNYGGTGYEEKVFFGLYDAYRQVKDETRAREMLAMYVGKYPDDSGVARAKKILDSPMPAVVAPAPSLDGGS